MPLYHWLGDEAESAQPRYEWKQLGDWRVTITDPAKWMEVVWLHRVAPHLFDNVECLFDPPARGR